MGWVQTPTYVSWVPLAPGETYYGHGYYGPHSVNITNLNITNIQAQKIVYRNVYVQNAVTVIHHDTFVTGRTVEVKVRENPFLKERINIGRPNIKPERTTIMPVIREIPQAKRPPAPIREIKVKELKESRPLVKAKEASVLRPGAAPKEMPIRPIERKRIERPVGIEKPKPFERGIEKPKDYKPAEKPREFKPPERGIEKPKPLEKGIEKPKEFKPAERGIEKPGPFEKGIEKPKEPRPIEKPLERPKEHIPAEKGIGKPD